MDKEIVMLPDTVLTVFLSDGTKVSIFDNGMAFNEDRKYAGWLPKTGPYSAK